MRWFRSGAWLERYVRFELALLAELGFGLDLGRCAVTGEQRGSGLRLAALGPRGQPRAAPGAYADRLLPLPAFLLGRAPADAGADPRPACA